MKRKPKEAKLREWPADAVERVPLAGIKPYPNNARVHSEDQITQIAASMTRFGVTTPVLVDEDGVLIYGHGRLRAAQKLGLTHLPVSVARGWSDDEKRAYRITDNQTALQARWDDQLLRFEVNELKVAGFDMQLLAFEPGQLMALALSPQHGQTDASSEWQGMPEFEQKTDMGFHSITVHFEDRKAMDKFAALIGQKVTTSTRFVWLPRQKNMPLLDKQHEVVK